MPYIGLGLHVLAAIYFAVHAIRSGQSLYWLILLFSFPLLGSVVYFLAIYFPEARNSRGARQVIRSAKQLMDPSQDLRNVRAELSRTPTLQNRVRLGMTLLDAGQANGTHKYGLQQDDFYQLHAYGRSYLDGQGVVALVYPRTDKLNQPLPVFDFPGSEGLRLWVLPFCLTRAEVLLPEGWVWPEDSVAG